MDLTRYPEILTDLIDKASLRLAEQHDMPLPLAREIVFCICEVIRKEWSGNNLYLAKGLAHDINQRDREMYEAFNGTNHAALAKKYNLTVRQVYDRIGLISAAEFSRKQCSLFD